MNICKSRPGKGATTRHELGIRNSALLKSRAEPEKERGERTLGVGSMSPSPGNL